MESAFVRADESLREDRHGTSGCHMVVGGSQGILSLPGGDRDLVDIVHVSSQDGHGKGVVGDAHADRIAGDQVDKEWIGGAGMVGSKDDRAGRQGGLPLDVKV